MLDYTRAAATKIQRDVHSMTIAATITAQSLAILSLLYILIKGEGIFAIKLSLLIVTTAYLIFYCAMTVYTERKHKSLTKKVSLAFQWSKRAIKLVNLAVVIYGFVGAEHTPLSLLMLTFTAFGVVLDIALGVISFIVEGWTQLVIEGVEYDVDKLVNSFKPANLFNKILGKEEVEPELTPNQRLLDKIVRQKKAEKLAQAAAVKAEKLAQVAAVKAEKRSAKQEKAAQKREKKAEKLAAKQAKKREPTVEAETAVTQEPEDVEE